MESVSEHRSSVILVHGMWSNPASFLYVKRRLTGGGWDHVEAFRYRAAGKGVIELAGDLARFADRVASRSATGSVHLVGHSLGGLIARAYAQLLGGERTVRSCITLATPHQGTNVAYAAAGRAALDLRPGSFLLRRLRAAARPSPVRFVSFRGSRDRLVVPGHSARIDEPALRARNLVAYGFGHTGVLLSGTVAAEVGHELLTAERAQPLPLDRAV